VLFDTLIDDASTQLAIPDSGSARADARRYLRNLATFLTRQPAGRVLLALIGEAQHDAEMASTFHARYLDPQRRAELVMLERGVASGELPADLDLDAALDSLSGPVLYRALVTGESVPAAFTDRLVDQILGRS
jgi:hypothetical protein